MNGVIDAALARARSVLLRIWRRLQGRGPEDLV